ncbi:MAG TPA: serine protease [Acidimicrobiales bacterium]|nr:serine protease [Acidimicrobiales bacterium]
MLPRTVLGLAALILAASVGAAFSGAVLYSYYEYRLQNTNDKVNNLVGNYKKQFDNAKADLAAQVAAAKAELDKASGPLRQLQGTSDAVQALIKNVGPSMFFVHTLDASGQASVGSAFAVASDARQTLLLTSYATVQAATKRPGPDVFIRQGGGDTKVTVWTWDEKNDLALIILPRGNVPVLQPAPTTPPPAAGDRVYVVSGLGSLGASASPGSITDVSAVGLQHSAAVGQAFQGGPLLNTSGQVLGLASRTYSPLNFTSDGVWFSPYVRAACERVLQCPGGNLNGPATGQHP